MRIARRGRSIEHDYRVVVHCANPRVAFEPYLVHLTVDSEVFPRTQESGVWFIHMLAGEMVYRYGDDEHQLRRGDSLTYDADAAHGIDRVVKLSITLLVYSYRLTRSLSVRVFIWQPSDRSTYRSFNFSDSH